MYVGSSTTNLYKRIKEHQGYGNAATYALNLKHWFKGTYRIWICEYKLVSNEPYQRDIRNIIQLLEDAISYDLKPAFGKQGSNNK